MSYVILKLFISLLHCFEDKYFKIVVISCVILFIKNKLNYNRVRVYNCMLKILTSQTISENKSRIICCHRIQQII